MYGQLIASVTVGAGGASTIDFTSIPGTFTDLVLVLSHRLDAVDTYNNTVLRVNGSSSGYSDKSLYGNGSSAGSDGNASNSYAINYKTYAGGSLTANTYASVQFYFPNYAGSTNKTIASEGVAETNGTTAYQSMTAGLWANTAAITSISFSYIGANYKQYSTAYLYGLTKGSGGATVS